MYGYSEGSFDASVHELTRAAVLDYGFRGPLHQKHYLNSQTTAPMSASRPGAETRYRGDLPTRYTTHRDHCLYALFLQAARSLVPTALIFIILFSNGKDGTVF